tara:strand:+ start:29 stop:472 length:444 start_codon:yes stop_codon:yes gene_type:complete
MDYKKTTAARTTISRNMEELSQNVGGNVYELIAVLKKRASQIGVEIKEELIAKLDEFATPSDTLEEVFENQEQTEISRFYERLPKPTLIAIQEMLDDEIYMREEVKKEEEIELEDGDLVLEEEGDEVKEAENTEEKVENSDAKSDTV